jgi:hypothetical protein
MEALDKACFADQMNRKYPIHTKEAALKSFEQSCEDRKSMPSALASNIESNFTKAASFHEIELKEPQVKTASRPEFTLAVEGADKGITLKQLLTEEELHKAASLVLSERDSEPCKNLREGAKYVIWAAANSDMDLNTPELLKVARIAGIGVNDRDKIEAQLRKRGVFASMNGPKDADTFWKFANDVSALSDEDFYKTATLTKLCDVMDQLDAKYGVAVRYGKELDGITLQAPEDAVFAQNLDDLTKEASDMLHIQSIDTVLSKKALLERSEAVNSFFTTYLGAEKPETAENMCEKVASLDENLAEALLERLEALE